jgi:spermidine/putrescine-binding protein
MMWRRRKNQVCRILQHVLQQDTGVTYSEDQIQELLSKVHSSGIFNQAEKEGPYKGTPWSDRTATIWANIYAYAISLITTPTPPAVTNRKTRAELRAELKAALKRR